MVRFYLFKWKGSKYPYIGNIAKGRPLLGGLLFFRCPISLALQTQNLVCGITQEATGSCLAWQRGSGQIFILNLQSSGFICEDFAHLSPCVDTRSHSAAWKIWE